MNKTIYSISDVKLGKNDMFACVSVPDQFLEQMLFSSLAKNSIWTKKKIKTIIEMCKVWLPVLVNPAYCFLIGNN